MTIAAILRKYSGAGTLVRNAILDQLLAWPLLVFKNAEQSVEKTVGATSVPTAVELVFDGEDRVDIRSSSIADSGGRHALDEWSEHLRHAADVGKGLWRAKNGNKGAWRDRVMKASVVYDFTVAEEIMRNAGLEPGFQDRSMESYFAQVVLAKAIGRHSGLAAAVSGYIGNQREIQPKKVVRPRSAPAIIEPDDPVVAEEAEPEMPPVFESNYILDWRMMWPGAIRQKKDFVYSSFKYDRFVLPPLYRKADSPPVDHKVHIETNHCYNLSDVADCVQPGGWRQFQYIRAHDAAQAMHRRPEELPAIETPEVTKCLSLLATSKAPIVRLPPDIEPAHLFSALYFLNFIRRLDQRSTPPSLSWTVVRATREELDGRFWHLLLRRVLSCGQAEFDSFRLAETPTETAAILANALNKLVPDEQHRAETAPDLLVVIGCDEIRADEDEDFLAEVRPQSFPGVIEVLEQEAIRPVLNERMRAFVGSTRVILVAGDGYVGAAAARADASPIDAEILARLTTFRFGFTQQMAAIILQNLVDDAAKVRSLLKRLVRRGVLTYHGGWYTVRPRGDAFVRTAKELTTDHFYAGLAFAPYLVKYPVPGLNLTEALLPDHVREAEWHFEQAAAAANAHLREPDAAPFVETLRNQARLGQHRLLRFFDTPSWAQVRKLARKRVGMPHREAYEIGEELLTFFDTAGRTPKPLSIAIVASAAAQWWQRLKRAEDADAKTVALLYTRACELFERALGAAKRAEQFPREQALNVATKYAAFLRRFGKSDRDWEMTRKLDEQIFTALRDGIHGYKMAGEWFEFHGDSLSDAHEARASYSLGMSNVSRWYGSFVKYAGASLAANIPESDIRAEFSSLGEEELDRLLNWMEGITHHIAINPTGRPWITKRWRAGAEFLNINFRRKHGRHWAPSQHGARGDAGRAILVPHVPSDR